MKLAGLAVLLLALISFSSCMHRSVTDAGTDEALGVAAASDADQAQQESTQLLEAQREEQKRRLDRQISESVAQQNPNQ